MHYITQGGALSLNFCALSTAKGMELIMNQKGWYPTSDAEAQEVQKAKDKFKPLYRSKDDFNGR